MNSFLLCCIGYLVGSIPTGFLLSKFFGKVDVRSIGSHSTGATNVLRSGHKVLALLTLLGDGIKGIIFAVIAQRIAGEPHYLVADFFCILGHVYPVWLGFKGGKGVATSAGIFVVLSPLFALVSIFIWLVLAKFIKISSVASIALTTSFAALCTYGYFFSDTTIISVLVFALITFIFLMITHSQNIKRILHHDEDIVTVRNGG